jgi:hypothetical protein
MSGFHYHIGRGARKAPSPDDSTELFWPHAPRYVDITRRCPHASRSSPRPDSSSPEGKAAMALTGRGRKRAGREVYRAPRAPGDGPGHPRGFDLALHRAVPSPVAEGLLGCSPGGLLHDAFDARPPRRAHQVELGRDRAREEEAGVDARQRRSDGLRPVEVNRHGLNAGRVGPARAVADAEGSAPC